MSATLMAPAAANPLRRLTEGVFSYLPGSLAMLGLRFAIAVPFWLSSQTKWDGWFTLSFGAVAQFGDLKLHILGGEYPFPAPETMALLAAIGETTFSVLLAFGLASRYAALGILGMTAIIQLSIPEGWANFHLAWASMALTIACFGPGKASLDYWLGLDSSPKIAW
jgi:putative oxidoreductase